MEPLALVRRSLDLAPLSHAHLGFQTWAKPPKQSPSHPLKISFFAAHLARFQKKVYKIGSDRAIKGRGLARSTKEGDG
jgi:hypothetical protein